MKPHPSFCTPPPQKAELYDLTWEIPTLLGLQAALQHPGQVVVWGEIKKKLSTIKGQVPTFLDQGQDSNIRLVVDSSLELPQQGYCLEINSSGVLLTGKDEAGLYYGLHTLGQWLDLHGPGSAIQGVFMEDYPHFPNRGVMLDVSRSKVPCMATLYEWVDQLAALKINQLQLYMEHTFAYEGHEQVWRDASPITGQEIQLLDTWCRERFVELVPNQNSFGHFHRWLIHQPYRSLAECPEGVEHPFSRDIEPFSLCPTHPGSLNLLKDLYGQLLPNFSSNLLNTGLDETLDLGMGGSRGICEEMGKEEVYLQFLQKVHDLAASHGRRMQFWGDIIIKRPDLLEKLPKDAIALEWGYEADHPFEEHSQAFAGSGLDFYVCPGTSGWSSLLGRVDNARENLKAAAQHGKTAGASGYLITDWGDFGHLQPLPVSYPGFVLGAAYAWNAQCSLSQEDLISALDRWVFRDHSQTMGRALCNLGNVYLEGKAPATNGSALFFILRFAGETMDHPRLAGLKLQGVRDMATRLDHIGQPWRNLSFKDHERVASELDLAVALAKWTCRFGVARFEHGPEQPVSQLPQELRNQLARELEFLIETHQQLWTARYREGGMTESCKQLTYVLDLLGDVRF